MKYQRELALKVLPNPELEYRTTGSLYLAYEKDYEEFHNEFILLHDVLENSDVEWYFH